MTFDRRALGSRAENLARFMEEMNLQSLSSQQHSAQNANQSAKGAAAPLAGTAERMSARDLSSSSAERASSLRDDRVSVELDPKLLGSSMPPRPAPLERRVDPSVEANGEHAVNEAELQHRLNGRTMGRRTS
ncbi:MAG: hypothetical protein IT290_06350 [Deltaproteobacteria bacterium]|nr:hypothetical protein [Deltaproteobacteria bacterium]